MRGPGSDLLVAASPVALAALLGVVTAVAALRFRWDFARLGDVPRSSLVLASAAAIAMLLVGSKVLSVQYVIWLLPFAILLPRRLGWLLLVITSLSTTICTIGYPALERLETPVILALLVRNVLLAAIAAWLVVDIGTRQDVARDVGDRNMGWSATGQAAGGGSRKHMRFGAAGRFAAQGRGSRARRAER